MYRVPVRTELPLLPRARQWVRDLRTGVRVRREWFDSKNGARYVIERWSKRGHRRPHREDGPALIERLADGTVRREAYFLDGMLGRPGAPADLYYGARPEWEERTFYLLDGQHHRIEGPALIRAHAQEWSYLGKKVSGPAEVGRMLAASSPERVLELLRWSTLGVLLDEGADPAVIVSALSAGVTSVEGMREVLSGTPAEWVGAFENGARS